MSDWPKDFREQFWNQYPRKAAKKEAMRKLERLEKLKDCPPWAKFLAAVLAYAQYRAGDDPRYTKHPATWIHQGCWDDELPGPGSRRQEERVGSGFAALRRDLMH
jgi:hypothetical protein